MNSIVVLTGLENVLVYRCSSGQMYTRLVCLWGPFRETSVARYPAYHEPFAAVMRFLLIHSQNLRLQALDGIFCISFKLSPDILPAYLVIAHVLA